MALLRGPRLSMGTAAPPPHGHTRELWHKSFPFVAPHGAALLAIALLALLGAALGAGEPLVLKWIFDELGGAHAARDLVRLVIVLAALLSGREVVSMRVEQMSWRVRLAVHESVTRATVAHLHALPLSYHRTHSVGGTLTKLERGINGAVAAFSEVAFQMAPTIAYLAMGLAVMVRLDWRVTLLVAAFVPVPALLSAWAAGEQMRRERTLMDRWTALFGRLAEVLSAIALVKSFAMEEAEEQRFLSGVSQANRVVARGVSTDTRVHAARSLAVVIARLCAIAAGGVLVVRGELSLGTL